MGIILSDFSICDPEEGRFNVWNQTFTDGDPGKTAVFHSFFPHVLQIVHSDYTRKDFTALGDIRTLSKSDRILINLPMAEVRDFHCSSHVDETFGKNFPSDHAAARLVILKPTHRRDQNKRIPSWMSKHPGFFGSLLQQLHDDHRCSHEQFCALAEFKLLLHQAQENDEA